MRADKIVYFVVRGTEVYNNQTGSYEVTTPVKTSANALVTDTGVQRMNLVYGGIKKHAKTVRLNQQYDAKYDYIEIDGEEYQVDLRRTYRNKQTFEVSRV